MAHRAFARGARVKLQERFARALMERRKFVDWLERRGTVVMCGADIVYVQWDGRTTMDTLPPKGVVSVEGEQAAM